MKNEDFKMESLSDSKFETLDINEMTKIVGGVNTTTCYASGGWGNDGSDSDYAMY